MRLGLFAFATICLLSTPAPADITLYVDAAAAPTPMVMVSVGTDADCARQPVVYQGAMTSGQVFAHYRGAGQGGTAVCWRRMTPPGPWTRCSADGPCQVF